MDALRLVDDWPAANAAVAVIGPSGHLVASHGPTDASFRIASLSKLLVTWAALVAVEERTLALDEPAGPPGSTIRHLLSHASGLPFDGRRSIAAPGRRRIYSNSGIEVAAEHLGHAADMAFGEYLERGVLEPLGMTGTTLRGSPAAHVWSTVDDLARFVAEVMAPTLITTATASAAMTAQFPSLPGVLPGLGVFRPLTWGLGFEIRADKQPHWTGTRNSPSTVGHFGGAGTFLWIDPLAPGGPLSVVSLAYADCTLSQAIGIQLLPTAHCPLPTAH